MERASFPCLIFFHIHQKSNCFKQSAEKQHTIWNSCSCLIQLICGETRLFVSFIVRDNIFPKDARISMRISFLRTSACSALPQEYPGSDIIRDSYVLLKMNLSWTLKAAKKRKLSIRIFISSGLVLKATSSRWTEKAEIRHFRRLSLERKTYLRLRW